MKPIPPDTDEFLALLDAACDRELTAEQHAKLETYLRNHPESRRIFIDHLRVRRQIRSWSRGKRSCRAGFERLVAHLGVDVAESAGLLRRPADGLIAQCDGEEAVKDPSSIDGGAGGLAPPSCRSPLPLSYTHSQFLNSATFSYLMASLFLGAMIVAGWAWRAPAGRTISDAAWRWEPAKDQHPPDLIGKITRAIDCRWLDPNAAACDGDSVPVGRGFDLVQGSLEITYDTGTKITLQGPAMFRADMHNGEFLAFGKLTARVGDMRAVEAEAAKDRIHSGKRQRLVCRLHAHRRLYR